MKFTIRRGKKGTTITATGSAAQALFDAISGDVLKTRPCTCHPDDNPPRPCPRKYALTECRAAAKAGGV
jgi:hypothetical protein